MRIEQNFSDEDKKDLESMMKFRYRMLYEPPGGEEGSRKILNILTPILYALSIIMYFIENYFVFCFVLFVAIWATLWIIWFHKVGKKYEEKVDDIVYNHLSKNFEVIIDEEKIVYGGEWKYSDIDTIVFYKNFAFFFIKKSGYFIFKLNNEEIKYLKNILDQHSEVIQEIKDKPFNILKYIKKAESNLD